MQLRAITNLLPDPDLVLPKSELKRGFLYLYNKGYSGFAHVFMLKLWASSVFPNLANDPQFKKIKTRKDLREYTKHHSEMLYPQLIDIRKVSGDLSAPFDIHKSPHIAISLPMFVAPVDSIDGVLTLLTSALFNIDKSNVQLDSSARNIHEHLMSDVDGDGKPVGSMHFTTDQVLNAAGFLDTRAKGELSTTVKGIRVVASGHSMCVYLDLHMSPKVAQQLTSTQWLEIRPIDLYPLMLHWFQGGFGHSGDAPLSSFPVSKVAETLPPVLEGDARINVDGLSVSADGTAYWLPKELNNTKLYEDMYTQVGSREDGGFRLADLSGDMHKVALPRNIPVLMDWVNNKYSYTTSLGFLRVLDLTRFKTLDYAHAYNIMTRRGLDIDQLETIIQMGSEAGVGQKPDVRSEDIAEMEVRLVGSSERLSRVGNMTDYAKLAVAAYRLSEEMDTTDPIRIADVNLSNPFLAPIARYIGLAHAAVLQNLEAVNARFAVSTVSINLALATLIAKYASNFELVTAEANRIRSAALNQGVDENWTPPAIPLLADNIGFLPHQAKVRNILKDSPDFALLPIQAGGGKTPIAITDILYEIKANRSSPYLILCPPHLVPQYVKELVYFTAGQINVLAVNTDTLRANGYERFTALFENAPRNTVAVVNYDILRYQQSTICYGTTPVSVYPVIEFLRQFNFGYAMLDESHSVKNDSARTRACMALIADIPKKRLASGTMAHDSPSDMALQVAMLDPTLFGSRDDFNNRYGEVVSNGRVMKWKPGAQQEIMRTIKSRIVVAGAMRKEWAALLPVSDENMFGANLTPAQYEVYNLIFAKTMEDLKTRAIGNKTLQKFLTPELQEDGSVVDESEGEDLASMLGPYLARLEQFTCAPASDPMGNMLKGDDRISPKVLMCIERIRYHLDNKLEGKVLVFTNYIESAEEIFRQLPDDLKAQAVLYKAEDKVEIGTRFERDDRLQIMIGVENSMNTGLNLQHVSHLIRVENVWNPGTLEQGNARVNRPELKAEERRKKIYYDWIIANRTIDVTKVARLVSKIVAIAKFENPESPEYQGIVEQPIIPMSLDAITSLNDWDNLKPYAQSLADYKKVRDDDYQEYKREYEEKYGPLTRTAIKVAKVPTDAKLMAEVPYAPGLELYGSEKLGLIRIDEFLRLDEATDTDDDSDEDENDLLADTSGLSEAQIARRELAAKLVGREAHCEFGDGEIMACSVKARRATINMGNGYKVRVKFSAAFISKFEHEYDIRSLLLDEVKTIEEITEEVDALPESWKLDAREARKAAKEEAEREQRERQKKKEDKLKASLSVEIQITISNGYLSLTHYTEDAPNAANALQALGFRPNKPFMFAEIQNAKQLVKQFDMWREAGFTLAKESVKAGISAAFRDMRDSLLSGKIENHQANFNFSTKNDLRNFYTSTTKPSTSTTEIKPYPMLEDGYAYIVLPLAGQAATKLAAAIRPPGVRWIKAQPTSSFFALNPKDLIAKLAEIQHAGIQIMNFDELRDEFKTLHKKKFRED